MLGVDKNLCWSVTHKMSTFCHLRPGTRWEHLFGFENYHQFLLISNLSFFEADSRNELDKMRAPQTIIVRTIDVEFNKQALIWSRHISSPWDVLPSVSPSISNMINPYTVMEKGQGLLLCQTIFIKCMLLTFFKLPETFCWNKEVELTYNKRLYLAQNV